jgi:hypothetical protein
MSVVLQRRRALGAGILDATIGESDMDHLPCSAGSGTQTSSALSPHGRSPINSEELETRRRQRRRRRRSESQTCSWRSARNLSVFTGLMALLLGGVLVVLYETPEVPFHHSRKSLLTSSLPRLPIPGVDVKVPNAIDWPLIHIVNTRFMQDQGPLTILGMARLHLFLTFCFPTMIAQSTQKFFWIIKTDPKFTTTTVFQLLIEAVKDHPNIYLVASNNNFLISPGDQGSWRDGAEGMDLLKSKIYTGNITKLNQAIALRNDLPVLETRLDADDGLHKYFIQYIQMVAMKRFRPLPRRVPSEDPQTLGRLGAQGQTKNSIEDGDENNVDKHDRDAPRWLYWCTRRHLEWHASSSDGMNEQQKQIYGASSSLGYLTPIQHSGFCVTPGMTVGYNVGVEGRDVPVQAHDRLYKELLNSTACYTPQTRPQHGYRGGSLFEQDNTDNKKNVTVDDDDEEVDANSACLVLVEDILFCAVRTRTWTSAGMKGIDFQPVYPPSSELIQKLWKLLEERFSLNQTRVRESLQYFSDHRREIAYENILGQCTSGHSCKEKAKEELKAIMERD